MSSAPHVAVIGAGVAGIAAAFAASRAGARVTIVLGGVGATALTSGAVDDQPWEDIERAGVTLGAAPTVAELPEDVRAFAAALGSWSLPQAGAPLPRLATTAGWVRSTQAYDPALLDLGRARGRTVILPRADRAGWDADALVRCLRESGAADGVSFDVATAAVLRFDEERDIVDIDLASRHDDPARLAWLAERLAGEARRRTGPVAFLLGPWLGVATSRAAELEARLQVPVGEALAATAGTAGARFESARARFLAELAGSGATTSVRGFATRVTPATKRSRELTVELDPTHRPSSETTTSIRAGAVVLASGGLVGGGLVYDPPEHGADAEGSSHARASLTSSVAVPGLRIAAGRDHGVTGSAFGPVLDDIAWPNGAHSGWLERAGILAGAGGDVGGGVFVAGDAAFGPRRTVLGAVRSALAAGASAAEHAARAFEPVDQLHRGGVGRAGG